ncbi:T9SS type A sorting domain-containing protein [bacterium]|nr:T9SS type A sorting domain-containing protein [bacterium]
MKNYLILLAFLFALGTANTQSIIHVDASNSGTQNGTSWATAFDNIQSAISSSSAGDSIFIAGGTYLPSEIIGGGSNSRDKTFHIPSGVLIYGGFAGAENSLSDRDSDSTAIHITNNTTLSGDIGTANDVSDNCYHVIVSTLASSTTVLDGLTISDGNANGSDSIVISGLNIFRNYGGGLNLATSFLTMKNCVIRENLSSRGGSGMNNFDSDPTTEDCAIIMNEVYSNFSQDPNGGGAGMRNDASHPTINNCRISENESYSNQGGGGMRNENGSNPVISNTVFAENYTEDGDGGAGMYNASGSEPILSDVSFLSNSTENQGAGMYNDSSIPTLTDCLFFDNFAEGGAGAMECDGGSDIFLTDCQFIENSTEGDGGAIQSWQSSPVMNNCLFDGNHADGDGGAIYNYNLCSPWITNSIIRNNTCDGNGGGIYNRRNCNPVLTQLLIYDNYAGIDGGGVYTLESNGQPCSPIATNVTIVRNEAGNSGGGAFDDGQGDSRLRNSIILGNTASSNDEVDAPAATAVTNLFYCIIGDEYFTFGTNTPTTYTGAVFFDPTNDDFHLAANSVGLNAGDSSFYANSATPDISSNSEDINGNPRVMGTNIDLGLYEVCTDTLTPTVSISVSPGDSIQDSTVTTFSSTTNVTSVIQYQWHKNGNNISGENASTYTAVADIDFVNGDDISLSILSNDQCSTPNAITYSNEIVMLVYTIADTTDTTVIDTGVGISGISKQDFSIYPNPTQNGSVTVTGNLQIGSEVYIYDLSGRQIRNEIIANETIQIDISKLDAGTYLIKAPLSDGSEASKRLLISD